MEKGFSMVELMVVLAIVFIVTAIGVSQFSAYKKRANDVVSASDLRTIVTEMNKKFEESGGYSEDSLPEVRLSKDVEYFIEITGSNREDFVAYSWHKKGTKTWCYTYNGPGREFGRKGLSSKNEIATSCSDGRALTSL